MAGQNFLPESRYSMKTHLSNWAQNPQNFVNTIVHVQPKEYLPGSGLFVLGNNFEGIIPSEELSIYPDDEPERLSGILIKRQYLVTAKICSFSNDFFILSRKETMRQALKEVFNEMNSGSLVLAKIASIYGTATYLDIGAGISALLPINEISSTYIEKDLLHSYFKGIDSILVKVINESQKFPNKFIASFKDACVPTSISVGDIVEGRVVRNLPDGTGKIIEITPLQSGIVDLGLHSWITLDMGQFYNFRVTRVRQRDNGVLHYSLELICE